MEVPKLNKGYRKDSSEDYVSDCSTQADITDHQETADFDQTNSAVKSKYTNYSKNSGNKYAKLASSNPDE